MFDAKERLTAALTDRYRVERELGAGGMATVYLAHDVRHDRKVAVKVLHAELAAVIGADRFLSEIRTTAHLQHPHILGLIDSGAADGVPYYVMPYVDGESLRDRLNREKMLPIGDALRIAREVADALAQAHRQQVVHRDIKPENILLQGDHALVADFGIALAVSTAGGQRLTQTGLSLGTPQYMSPEQAMGDRALDARTDVYALGAVLYEMLTGEAPFTGPTAQAIFAKVLTDTPRPPSHMRRTVPAHVESTVLTALEKLPADRFGSASAFATALTSPGTVTARPVGGVSKPRVSRATIVAAALALIATALGAFLLGGRLLGAGAGPAISFGRAVQVTHEAGLEIQPALSPDGRSVAYTAGTSAHARVYVRAVSGGRALALTNDTAEVATTPSWSADGSRILFLARRGAFSVPASGGPARQELPSAPGVGVTWAAWAPNDSTLAYTIEDSLYVRDPQGRARRVGTLHEPSFCAWNPAASLIACVSGNAGSGQVGVQFGNLSPSQIVVVAANGGPITTIADTTSLNESPKWSPDGRWLYYVSDRDGPRDIYAQRVSSKGEPSGAVVRVSTGLGAQSISFSRDGRHIAYAALTATGNAWSQPLTVGGHVSNATATPVTSANQIIETVDVSRDGRWLYYASDVSGNADLYRVALPNGEPERLTSDPSDEFAPNPSPDGRELAFHSWRKGSRDIYVMPLDGGPARAVTESPQQEWVPRWSPDGTKLTFSEVSVSGAIWVVRRNADGTWGTPLRRLAHGHWPVWSPDGRHLAYLKDTFLGGSIEVMPVDSGASRRILDASKPGNPPAELLHWSEDGRAILFKSHDSRGRASIWSVPVGGGTPQRLLSFDDPLHPSYRSDWSLARGRIYYSMEDRRSDVWVMEVISR